MFRKIKDKLLTVEVVLDALIELLHKKDIVHREEIQVEILARAGERLHVKKKFKLYELPKGSKIYGYDVQGEDDAVIIFDHVDGMYSYCYIEGNEDKVVHLSASLQLRKYKDGFKEA